MNATTPHFVVIVSRTGIWVRTRGEIDQIKIRYGRRSPSRYR